MNFKQTLAEAIKKLEEKKIQTPRLDAEVLLSHALKKQREFILTHLENNLTVKQQALFNNFIKRRLKHEPVAYILGQKEFFGLNFKVNKYTLIPRPETEHLVENVLKINPKGKTIIDLGTGSGNIIISLVKNLKNKNNYFGIDISSKALSISKYNAKKHGVAKKIKFIKSDLLNYFTNHYKLLTTNCVLVANLPYLSPKIYSTTNLNVKNFEPKSALCAKQEGLYYYEKLFQQIKKITPLIDSCSLIIEISPEQKLKISKIFRKYFPKSKTKFQRDLAGKWRMATFNIQN